MPKRNTNTAKTAAAARKNGEMAGRTHTLKAARKRFGDLSPQEERQVMSWAERYKKAQALREEELVIEKKRQNQVRSGELVEAQTIREYVLRLVAGLRREVDSIPVTIQGITVPTDATDQLRMCITAMQKRMRERFSSMPEWLPGETSAT